MKVFLERVDEVRHVKISLFIQGVVVSRISQLIFQIGL